MPVKVLKKQLKTPSRRSRSSSGQTKISKKYWETTAKWTKLLAAIVGFSFFLVIIICFIPIGFTQSDSAVPMKNASVFPKQEQKIPEQEIPASPVRLIIPKIKVDAVIESLGLTAEGAVDSPKDPAKTAWYNLGPRPGDNGNAIISGHYGPWKDGRKSVFDNLSKLKKGDKILVKDDNGISISFVVREIKRYDKNAQATEVFNSTDGKSHLNIITCGGVWSKVTRSYSQRLVVFTDRE